MCILFVYTFIHFTLFKVVSYYDLSVLSMSVMGFQKSLHGGVVGGGGGGWVVGWGGVHSIQFYCEFLEFY